MIKNKYEMTSCKFFILELPKLFKNQIWGLKIRTEKDLRKTDILVFCSETCEYQFFTPLNETSNIRIKILIQF